jgi:hypothetical protein
MRTLVNQRTNRSFGIRRQETVLHTEQLLDLRHLTTEEVCRVNLATIREGINHCRWPREVIERFLAVEV